MATTEEEDSLLDAVHATAADPLTEAVALGDRAAIVGFDWEFALEALEKVEEEAEELREVLEAHDPDPSMILSEIGDLLFAACMVARKSGIDPVEALGATNAKFRARFAYIERELTRQGVDPEDATLEEMEALWQASKRALSR
ncbi:MAG: MazG nucleotide pyrophosphohydrolase domain-containing protein [Myxococcota bacterium]|nr:MazG nucleotide pyrophosphohydrolase domain-containing protein [Myxococcota bacterium]MEC9440661.1 MazG nucleotide pyrophosphohydrolase domain-containing protein [Myxococcota bacterium]